MCHKLPVIMRKGYGIRRMPTTLKMRDELRYYKLKGVTPK